MNDSKKKVVIVGGVAGGASAAARLRRLDENAEYVINNGSETYTGKALMSGGVLVPKTSGDYSPIEMHITKVRS